MYMPGLTSGQAPLGGSGFTPEALRTANQGLSPADRAYLMDVGGVSPAEASAAIGTPVGQLQAEYNQLRPGGLFSTGAPASRGLPEDFALQTGAYGAPTPTFFTPPQQKQHRYLSQVVQTQTSLVLLVVLVVMVKVLRAILILPVFC
jgi:hypothetical protein